MNGDIRLDELVSCTLCLAVVTRDGRTQHLAWHARLNARLASRYTQEYGAWIVSALVALLLLWLLLIGGAIIETLFPRFPTFALVIFLAFVIGRTMRPIKKQ